MIAMAGAPSTGMKPVTLPYSGKVVSVPSTGSDWHLYSSVSCSVAARQLTGGLVSALKTVDRAAKRGFKPTESGVEELVEQYLFRIMVKWSRVGACDSEPRHVAYGAIEGIVRQLTGEAV